MNRAAALSFQGGLEQWFYSTLALRAGYQWAFNSIQVDGLAGITAGLGLAYNGLRLDYAYLPFGDLETPNASA